MSDINILHGFAYPEQYVTWTPEITSSVPIPQVLKRYANITAWRIDWGAFEVGDSVQLPPSLVGYYTIVRGLATRYPKRLYIVEWNADGARVWRAK